MQDLTLIIPAKNEPDSLPYILVELEKLNLNYIIIMEKNDFKDGFLILTEMIYLFFNNKR